eukprot:3529282-Rhodomonas_salina.1
MRESESKRQVRAQKLLPGVGVRSCAVPWLLRVCAPSLRGWVASLAWRGPSVARDGARVGSVSEDSTARASRVDPARNTAAQI